MNVRLRDWVDFFAEVGNGNWILAGTITLHDIHPTTGRKRHPKASYDTAKHLLRRINKAAFNHRADRHGATVASVMILGDNAYGEQSHIHFAFGQPNSMSDIDFHAVVEKAIIRTRWCNREFDIRPYRNDGWLQYLLAHGTEKLIIDCCCKAKP